MRSLADVWRFLFALKSANCGEQITRGDAMKGANFEPFALRLHEWFCHFEELIGNTHDIIDTQIERLDDFDDLTLTGFVATIHACQQFR